VRLRLLVIPMRHGSRQLRVQTWNERYTHWDTLGRLQADSSIWRELVNIFGEGAKLLGIPCEVQDQAKVSP
jgi:hypothetical protein